MTCLSTTNLRSHLHITIHQQSNSIWTQCTSHQKFGLSYMWSAGTEYSGCHLETEGAQATYWYDIYWSSKHEGMLYHALALASTKLQQAVEDQPVTFSTISQSSILKSCGTQDTCSLPEVGFDLMHTCLWSLFRGFHNASLYITIARWHRWRSAWEESRKYISDLVCGWESLVQSRSAGWVCHGALPGSHGITDECNRAISMCTCIKATGFGSPSSRKLGYSHTGLTTQYTNVCAEVYKFTCKLLFWYVKSKSCSVQSQLRGI